MKTLKIIIPFLYLGPLSFAQLTPDQKVSDFMQLAGLYAKNYGPYEEKRDVFGFDLYKIQPWLTQVQQSESDIDFYDICVKYVASLQDSHDEFTIQSDYEAWLHFDGDIYDGKFLIDSIDRSYLPRSTYKFTIGDQLISVDGVAVADLLTQFAPYAVNAASNPVSRARIAAATITDRLQALYPRATSIRNPARPDYGIDAPGVVRNLFLAGLIGVSLRTVVTLLLKVGQVHIPVLILALMSMAFGTMVG